MRLFKISLWLTCNPEEVEKDRIFCDESQGCDACLKHLKLVEKIVGPNFKIQKMKIDELLDLKES